MNPSPRTGQTSLTVVANRLPVEQSDSGWSISPGGLVAAVHPVLGERGGTWVGWDGTSGRSAEAFEVDGLKIEPVGLTAAEVEEYYGGFSNGTLWPLYHDKVHPPQFHRHWWRPYQRVNRRFARRTAEVAPEGGSVWVHDYQLSLVPALLRHLRPDLRIGFFLHIPFPPPELFAQIPWRRQLLTGMLGADSIGFQTIFGVRNFKEVTRRYLGARSRDQWIEFDGHRCAVEAFPISIDTREFSSTARSSKTTKRVHELRGQVDGRRILLGVDRLDYTKGIQHRLRAFDALLDRRPDLTEKVVFVQLAVPSRENVDGYSEMRLEIEGLAGRINGKHARLGKSVVNYFYDSLERPELIALYRAADVMVVTPPRDGMNLVAKEFVACRVKIDGVLVLSEFAGAARELDRALLVNPFDIDGTTAALEQAIEMPGEEQRARMLIMRRHLFRHDVYRWANRAIGAIDINANADANAESNAGA